MQRLTPGITRVQTIQRPLAVPPLGAYRGVPYPNSGQNATNISAKTEAMVVQHRTAWPRGATWRSALWAVSIAYQATTTASARVGVLPLEASLPYTMWLMGEQSAHLLPIRCLSCERTTRYRKVGAQAIYHARVLAASHSIRVIQFSGSAPVRLFPPPRWGRGKNRELNDPGSLACSWNPNPPCIRLHSVIGYRDRGGA
jgi:hypothetical protein